MEQKKEDDEFTVEVIKTEDGEDVLRFLRQHFYKVQQFIWRKKTT